MRVLDMTAVISGPYASQALGDMGADVIKVEPPEGDGQRMLGPHRHLGMGPIFMNSNRSKRAIGLDLKNDEGRTVLLRLAKDVDVLLYNMRPQAMDSPALMLHDPPMTTSFRAHRHLPAWSRAKVPASRSMFPSL